MTSTDNLDLDLSRRLNSGLQRIASAHGVDQVLLATASAARDLANATGLCTVPIDHSHSVIATPEYGIANAADHGSPLMRLITAAAASNEAIVQHRPQMDVALPSGPRLRAETLLTVPMGTESGFVGLAFFWHDGHTPTTSQMTLLLGLAWTCCLALRAQQQQSQIDEIRHRARNVLATVRSIIRRSGQAVESPEEFVSHLEARISALARTQGALTLDHSSGPELEDLVRAELTANAVRDSQFVIAGPSWRLPARAAETMALTLHELAMNALKFGAFSVPDGRLSVNWRIDHVPAPTLRWRWIESNVPIARTTPARRGFGRELIERLLPYELGAVSRYTLADDGARCEIDLPINELTAVEAGRSSP